MNTSGQPAPSRALRWIGLAVAAAALIGSGVYFGLERGQLPEDAALESVVPDESSEQVAAVAEPEAPEDTSTEQADASDAPAPVAAPTFDEVRQEADGLTVIAGRAEPGSTVTVLVDGEETAEAVADARGSFAAVGFLDPGAEGSVVTLRQGEGEESTSSDEEIILAPLPQTDQTAASDEAATSETAEVATEPSQDTPAEPVAPADGSPVAALDITQPALTPTPQDVPDRPAEVEEDAVPERQRVAVLKSTQGGVELLQAPPVIETVALDTIGYSAAGDVQLSGRAQPGSAQVRIYLNNASVAQIPVGSDGRWRAELPGIEPGIYTMRVDQLDDAGRVTSRVETPFKREAVAVLAEAAAAADGPITAITVQRGDTLWAIARDRYGEGPLFVRVFEANREAIRDPDLIYPGQVFDLPD